MGGCLSSGRGSDESVSSSALVISPTGDLRPYSTPVLVSDVLKIEEESSSSSSFSFFVCNSDNLSYDEHITPLDAQHELDAGQIYFILPVSKLRNRLSASEMAALAVKASVALNTKPSFKTTTIRPKARSNNKSKISPFVVMESSKINVIVDQEAQNKRSSSVGVSRSGSIRKMQRYSSRKAKLAVRSFRLRLSTIYETESSDQSQKLR